MGTSQGTWDLGDTITLTTTAVDGAGDPVNCDDMALRINQPDGTIADPPDVTNPPAETGQYTADFVPTQEGRHQIRWIGTDPAYAYTDVFYVMPAFPLFLISLADARAALGKRAGSSTASDEDLRFYIAAVTPVIQAIVGLDLVEEQTWTADGGRFAINLPDIPVSVQGITENAEDLVEGTDFSIDYLAGIVYRGTTIAPYPFIDGRNNIVISYTTGTGVISENLRLAARIILAHLWQADQQGYRPAVGGAPDTGDVVTVSGGYAIPRRAAQLLQPAEDLGGFA